MKKLKLLHIVALLVVFSSCQKEAHEETAHQANQLDYLKTWLANHYGKNPTVEKSKATVQAERKKPNPKWGNEKVVKRNDTLVVEVPTDFDGQVGYAKGKIEGKGPKVPKSSTNILLLETKNSVAGYIVTMISDNEDKPENPYVNKNSKFSGDLFYYDLDGKFLAGYRFNKGKKNGVISEVKNPTGVNKSGSKNDTPVTFDEPIEVNCTEYEIYQWWSDCAVMGEIRYDCFYFTVYIGNVTICESEESGDPGPPPCTTCPLPQDKPCPGNVVKNPTIAASNSWNVNGGRFGLTRTGEKGPKMHKGLDISAEPNTPLYSMYGGEVVRVVNNVPQGDAGYSDSGFGNLIEIKTTLPNGEKIITRYAHMNSVNYKTGDTIFQGDKIGLSGKTGNAVNVKNAHVHIEVLKGGVQVNPEAYMTTKFDVTGNPITTNPCN